MGGAKDQTKGSSRHGFRHLPRISGKDRICRSQSVHRESSWINFAYLQCENALQACSHVQYHLRTQSSCVCSTPKIAKTTTGQSRSPSSLVRWGFKLSAFL